MVSSLRPKARGRGVNRQADQPFAARQRARTELVEVNLQRSEKKSIAKVARRAAGTFGNQRVCNASAAGALRGVACYRLTVGYAACAAALGAAAAAAAAAGLEDAGEVAAAAMLALQEVLGSAHAA
ncbi:unnamed protein product [Durusdinium trenchii]|uniref:Uncharacterized protein n=2 Tax=Durusdinium trenchii TaxID=1381693 RepID=A0ABP0RIH3_9DINO